MWINADGTDGGDGDAEEDGHGLVIVRMRVLDIAHEVRCAMIPRPARPPLRDPGSPADRSFQQHTRMTTTPRVGRGVCVLERRARQGLGGTTFGRTGGGISSEDAARLKRAGGALGSGAAEQCAAEKVTTLRAVLSEKAKDKLTTPGRRGLRMSFGAATPNGGSTRRMSFSRSSSNLNSPKAAATPNGGANGTTLDVNGDDILRAAAAPFLGARAHDGYAFVFAVWCVGVRP